jgi:hypothetical protein
METFRACYKEWKPSGPVTRNGDLPDLSLGTVTFRARHKEWKPFEPVVWETATFTTFLSCEKPAVSATVIEKQNFPLLLT